jgi:hypothetical protein
VCSSYLTTVFFVFFKRLLHCVLADRLDDLKLDKPTG